jgi:hypothetical protein
MTLGTQTWAEPVLEWSAALDYAALQDRLQRDAELLTTWPVAPSETFPTDCYRLGEHYWISQRGVGAVRFTALEPQLSAFPFPDSDTSWFREVVQRAWLPAIYPFWGRQVIHASAAGPSDTGDVIAFTGPTLAGKSTTAYAMGRRAGWRLISDDTLAFTTLPGDRIRLHPLRNEARLRPASADYFGKTGDAFEQVEWPSGPLSLRAVYVLDAVDDRPEPPRFEKLGVAERLPLLLQQAYALSFKIPKYNQELMTAYAHLAASVPVYRLRFQRSFAVAGALFDAIDQHAAAELTLQTSAGVPRPTSA